MFRTVLLFAAIFCFYPISGFSAEQPVSKDLSLRPDDPASPVHPRRFGLPGGIGQTRGWYVWRSWNPKTWQAEVSHEGTGGKYSVRVLPWLTTYRHLAYGAYPDDLLPGERVNLFFNPDAKQPRAYLVHFQDELSQMKGHNHAWQVESVRQDGAGFTARVMAGDKPLDEHVVPFKLDPKCQVWSDGKQIEVAKPVRGARIYLTWVYDGTTRVVKLFSDAGSLEELQADTRQRFRERTRKEGLTGFVEEVAKDKTRLLIFATWWAQAGELKPGVSLRMQLTDSTLRATGAAIDMRLVSRKNLGTYGSGCSELIVEALNGKQLDGLRDWMTGKVVRIVPGVESPR